MIFLIVKDMITDKTFRTFENLEHFDRVYKKSQVAILVIKLWLHFATVQTFLNNDTLNLSSQSWCTGISVDVRLPWNSLGCMCKVTQVILSIPVYLFYPYHSATHQLIQSPL